AARTDQAVDPLCLYDRVGCTEEQPELEHDPGSEDARPKIESIDEGTAEAAHEPEAEGDRGCDREDRGDRWAFACRAPRDPRDEEPGPRDREIDPGELGRRE